MLNQGNFYRDLLNDSSVSTNNLILTGNDANSVPYINTAKVLADRILTNGQLLIGATGNAPLAGNITGSSSVIVTNGLGTIAIDAVQPITTTSNPQFASINVGNITDTGLSINSIVGSNASKQLQSLVIASANANGTNNSLDLLGNTLTLNSTMTQNLDTTGSPTFVNATYTGLSFSKLLATTGSRQLQSVSITNIISNGNNSIIGFAGGILTLNSGMTQNLDTTGAPTFDHITLNAISNQVTLKLSTVTDLSTTSRNLYILDGGAISTSNFIMSNSLFQQVIDTGITFSTKPTITPLTATRLVSTDAGNVLQSVTIANANGCNVSFSGSTLTNTMTQNLDVTGSPTFVGLTTSGATASTLLGTTTGKALQSVTIQNLNGCNASYNSTTALLTLTMTQDLRVTAVPSFNRINLSDSANQITMYQATLISASTNAHTYTLQDMPNSNFVMSEGTQTINGSKTFGSSPAITTTTNQLVLGTTLTTTITAPAPVTSRIVTLPDVNIDSSFVLTEGAQTINGIKTFGSSIRLPTVGGTPTTLNYYESYSNTTQWGGAYGVAVNGNVYIIRIGAMVTANFPQILGACTVTNPLWMLTNMPARFNPPNDLYIVQGIAQTAAGTTNPNGIFYISAAGNYQYHNSTGQNFSNAGSPTVGLAQACSVSWLV